jgi:predicted GIY-YIG superfamily endonuclease
LIFTIYNDKRYDNHNQTRYEYFIEEYNNFIEIIKQKDIALVYLRLIRDKAIKKSYSKTKKKLIKVIENYAKSK